MLDYQVSLNLTSRGLIFERVCCHPSPSCQSVGSNWWMHWWQSWPYSFKVEGTWVTGCCYNMTLRLWWDLKATLMHLRLRTVASQPSSLVIGIPNMETSRHVNGLWINVSPCFGDSRPFYLKQLYNVYRFPEIKLHHKKQEELDLWRQPEFTWVFGWWLTLNLGSGVALRILGPIYFSK